MAAIWGAVIAGGAALASGAMSSQAAKGAAGDQTASTMAGIGEQGRQYDLTRSDQLPYRQAGTSAVSALDRLMGFAGGGGVDESDPRYMAIRDKLLGDADAAHQQRYGMSIFDNRSGLFAPGQRSAFDENIRNQAKQQFTTQYGDPSLTAPDAGALNRKFSVNDFWQDPVTQLSYQSGLDLGTKALRNAAPLTTGLDSGAALKELTKFGTDYAGSKAGESYSRFEGDKSNVFNKLMAMVGGGQVANQVNAAAGTNAANNVSGMLTNLGNAQGAARIGQANAWGGGVSSIANWWNQQNTLDRFFPRAGATRTGWPMGDYGYGMETA